MTDQKLVTSVGMAPFAEKHFLSQGKKSAMITTSVAWFLDFVNEAIQQGVTVEQRAAPNMEFCRYIFIPNFTQARPSHMRIDNSNAQWLRSAYEARTERELPVLVRWLDLPVQPPLAEVLMLILYSRDQLLKEAEHSKESVSDAPWSIISILALNEMVVPPMPPITMMRNELGVDQGGNGVPIDHNDYAQAVEYWNAHAMVR